VEWVTREKDFILLHVLHTLEIWHRACQVEPLEVMNPSGRVTTTTNGMETIFGSGHDYA
jgi:hypothetical protein